MTTYPHFPRVLKGDLVLTDPESARVLRIVTLQYNPEKLMRSLQRRTSLDRQTSSGAHGDRCDIPIGDKPKSLVLLYKNEAIQ
jgi:hypothetical protein